MESQFFLAGKTKDETNFHHILAAVHEDLETSQIISAAISRSENKK